MVDNKGACLPEFPRLVDSPAAAAIVRAVRDLAPVSRTRIVQTTGLPAPAVTRHAADLRERGILEETAYADQTGPRRKRGLRLNGRAGHALAVAYTDEGLEGAVMDAAYHTLALETEAVNLAELDAEGIIEHIVAFVQHLRAAHTQDAGPCLGLALADPGIIDFRNGMALHANMLPNWRDVPVAALAAERLRLPVMLQNSLLAMLRAVDRLEVDPPVDDLVYVEFGAGVGCGMKLGGRYIRGASGMAGEFGHLRVTERPTPCNCGLAGCLEAVASLTALERQSRAALTEQAASCLRADEPYTGLEVLRAAGAGDRLAGRVVREALTYLAVAVAGLINTLDPALVVFSQRLQLAGAELLEFFFHTVRMHTSGFHPGSVDLRISSLAAHVSVRGAATAVLDHCLQLDA